MPKAAARSGAAGKRGGERGGMSGGTAVAPARVFDNLYYVGLASVSAWVVKTSAGLILIDALNNGKDAQETIVPGIRALGLDPAQIKNLSQ